MNENIVQSLVRTGTVSDINAGALKARVCYSDLDSMVSGWLTVVQHPRDIAIKYHASPAHQHEDATAKPWMPAVNQRVLVLYLPTNDSDGFILGVI